MRPILSALLALALLSSCTLALGSQNAATKPSSLDLSAFQDTFMLSYYADRSGLPAGAASGPRALTPFQAPVSYARATVPINTIGSLSFAALSTPTSLSNYPEPGESTSFTAAFVTNSGGKIYDVSVTTTFPATNYRGSYVERYFVRDTDANDQWTIADPIGTWNGTTWADDAAARSSMVLTYSDGSTREEAIYSTTATTGPKYDYAALSIDGGLDLSQIGAAPATTSDPKVMFSSVVVYAYKPARNGYFWFWSGKAGAGIIGVRYYTEYADTAGDRYVGRSGSFEKTLGSFGTYGISNPAAIISAVFDSSLKNTLCESVIRQEVTYGLSGTSSADWKASGAATGITTKMMARVANLVTNQDFLVNQLNSNAVSVETTTSSIVYLP
jgi:hypothetical protein